MKICSMCQKQLDSTFFHKDSKAKDKLCTHCKQCALKVLAKWRKNNPEKVARNRKNYYDSHRGKIYTQRKKRIKTDPELYKLLAKKYARINLLRKYGLTEKSYQEKLLNQEHRCEICKVSLTKVNIDHCHKTGKTRGLLCYKCNLSLGYIEKENFLEKALLYISKYK